MFERLIVDVRCPSFLSLKTHRRKRRKSCLPHGLWGWISSNNHPALMKEITQSSFPPPQLTMETFLLSCWSFFLLLSAKFLDQYIAPLTSLLPIFRNGRWLFSTPFWWPGQSPTSFSGESAETFSSYGLRWPSEKSSFFQKQLRNLGWLPCFWNVTTFVNCKPLDSRQSNPTRGLYKLVLVGRFCGFKASFMAL